MFDKVVDEPLIRLDHTTIIMPYATKRGWVFIPRRKSSWKRYYALLYEGSLFFQRKPLVCDEQGEGEEEFLIVLQESKWRKRINNVKIVASELQRILLRIRMRLQLPLMVNVRCSKCTYSILPCHYRSW
jgi:hypothetical protein